MVTTLPRHSWGGVVFLWVSPPPGGGGLTSAPCPLWGRYIYTRKAKR
ncbi:hypothetical protein CLERM_096 [Coxiella-like endosymbiont]|nr:hypothetical protein CLERM_096 [Coxiella-like endosymbiont]